LLGASQVDSASVGACSHSSRLVVIVVQHVSQDVLGILQSLGHFGVVALESMVQGQSLSFTLLVDVGHQSALRIQQDLCVVLEVHLHDLVAQSEHNSMLRSHPLLNIDWRHRLRQGLG
jgi:hypothetical protein